MRGIDYFQVPSTFLAQVDSSVGGKVGVNLPEGKNLVGSFHHPLAVFADMELLGTLPDRELRAGSIRKRKGRHHSRPQLGPLHGRELGEDPGRDEAALEKVIAASIRMKADVVGKDERESGLRMILNLGHTLGHAIESVTRYRKLLHGEAVGWGLIAAFYLGFKRSTITEPQFDRLMRLIYLYGPLPALKINAQRLVNATAKDKKHLGNVRRFVLPVGIGDACVVEDVSAEELLEAARTCSRWPRNCLRPPETEPSRCPRESPPPESEPLQLQAPSPRAHWMSKRGSCGAGHVQLHRPALRPLKPCALRQYRPALVVAYRTALSHRARGIPTLRFSTSAAAPAT
jgi:3-dehydroquinate synthetase